MKTPRDKYQNDPKYHRLVDVLVDYIKDCQFTPSEVREASMLACIIYEENRVHWVPVGPFPEKVIQGLTAIHDWTNQEGKE